MGLEVLLFSIDPIPVESIHCNVAVKVFRNLQVSADLNQKLFIAFAFLEKNHVDCFLNQFANHIPPTSLSLSSKNCHVASKLLEKLDHVPKETQTALRKTIELFDGSVCGSKTPNQLIKRI